MNPVPANQRAQFSIERTYTALSLMSGNFGLPKSESNPGGGRKGLTLP